jgi:hypothetical protein
VKKPMEIDCEKTMGEDCERKKPVKTAKKPAKKPVKNKNVKKE